MTAISAMMNAYFPMVQECVQQLNEKAGHE